MPTPKACYTSLLVTKQMKVTDIRTLSEGKHLKFRADGIDAIAFGMGEMVKSLQNGQSVSLAYTPEIDAYNGFEKLQLRVKDLHVN